jgi:hypothetical protein
LYHGTNTCEGTGGLLRVGVRHAQLPFTLEADPGRPDVHIDAATAIGFDQFLNLLLRLARGRRDAASS